MNIRKLLSDAADTIGASKTPEIVNELCGDFLFDKTCPADHARKVAVAAYEAGRQSANEDKQ